MSSKVYMAEANEINGYTLTEIVNEHYEGKVKKYVYLYDLYKGEHNILETVQTDPLKPNNTLVNNYFGEIVDTAVGYFLGKPIVVSNEDDDVEDELQFIFEDNEIDDVFMEVGKECGIKGKSAIFVYQNEDSETKISKVPAEEVIFIYDSSRTEELLYAIRVYEMDIAGEEETVRYAEVWSKEEVSYWIEDEKLGMFILDDEREAEGHIFEAVPIVEVVNNGEKMGDFEKVITLVNDFDKVFSNASNELEAFRNAYLMIKNMSVDSDTITRLKEQGIIEVMENGDVKFITKDIPSEFMGKHLDRLQDNIYRFSQVPNLSDEKFANNLSGVAIRFKLFGLETKCIQKERKLTKSIKQLLKLLAVPIKVKTGKQLDLRRTDIQFTRNVPNNLLELADVVSKLQGVLDKETLLSILPFIDDPKSVIEAMEKEQDSYQNEMGQLTGGSTAGGFNQAPTLDE